MNSTMRILTIVTLVLLSVTANAFDDFDQKVANIDVLRDKNVQKELGITESQRTSMNVYADKYSKAGQDKIAEYEKAKKKPDQAYLDFANAQFVTLRTNVLKILSAAQTKRLREITLQAVGPRALLDKNVATKVGMTNDEFTRFSAAIREGDQKVAKIKGQVSTSIRAKYKDQKEPSDAKARAALQAKIQKDLAAEMKKHDPEMKAIINASENKTKAIVKKQYLDSLKTLMGKPFTPVKPAAQATKPAPTPSAKAPAKKGG